MFAVDDTIVAIATPAGRGGLGVVRVSGPRALEVAAGLTGRAVPLEPRHATFARVRGRAADAEAGSPLDEAVVTWFPAPASYTGEDVVEIGLHGSPVVLNGVLREALAAGARLARPGEFTLRGFLNGKRDLVQAEAVADIVDAVTPLQAKAAFDQLDGTLTGRIAEIDGALLDLVARLEASLDFPDEGYRFIDPQEIAANLQQVSNRLGRLLADATRGRVIREGATVVIVGRPNVGKSSLFNVLLGHDRAIVTPRPGTTRDVLTERVDVRGLAITLVDTAGAHEAGDDVEQEGVARGRRARGVADLLLVVLDASCGVLDEDATVLAETAGHPRVVVVNKQDLAGPARPQVGERVVEVSTRTGLGVDDLRAAIVEVLCGKEPLRDSPGLTNIRHVDLVREARTALDAARDLATAGAPEELVVEDLSRARTHLEGVVGVGVDDEILHRIFERFCIGK